MSDKVIYIESVEDFNEVVSRDGVILIDFYADWCGPCKMLAPVIDKLAEEYDGKATICKLNVDRNQAIAEKYNVQTIPTIFFVKDKKVYDKTVGVISPVASLYLSPTNEKKGRDCEKCSYASLLAPRRLSSSPIWL